MPSAQFKAKDLVFVPCPEGKTEEGPFLTGVVCEVPEEGDPVVQVGKTTQRIPASSLRRRFIRDDGATSQDNTSLVHLNDATILENLRARHEADEIYTYTASVLLAVNPYHDVTGLYGEAQCTRYRGKHIGALPPHPYAIADTAYRALVRDHKNQGFIISGESGAGKTETAKIVMEYLGYVSGSTNQMTAQIQRRVLQAQPILESFGNAVTMRNNNSSRFGKYNSIFFDEDGTLCDASVTTYLLESSRVVVHAKRERTYHCFYEMLAGLPDEKLKKLHLERSKLYLLLANEGQTAATQEETSEEKRFHAQFQDLDLRNFRRLCVALGDVGFSEEDIDSTFQVLAGLVHLGDLASAERDDDDESATIVLDEATVEKAASLLGMEASELGGALRRRKVKVSRPGRESIHEVPRTTLQFRHALYSLIKALYKRLFERLVTRINGSFSELRKPSSGEEETERCQIGILDIYGFERLQRNSFEQLCINLANERLQQYFVENVLTAEQNLYRREGLPWTGLNLPDSMPVVTAIACCFKTLDEYSQQLAKGFEKTSDEGFCQKTVEEAQKDAQRKEVLRPLKMSNKRGSSAGLAMNEGFVIKHYAGQVEYNTKGWLDKNNDRLLVECEELICGSDCQFVRTLGDDEKGKVLFRSISKKYSSDLENLLKTLNQCHLHYIRPAAMSLA
ncbi:XI-2 [Symbiodinium natans]|uniref:XI-2 protein n=1 Tax=Symbiodinium natans TaxID=878477 RepID=A0A812UGY1_9DINO|nr:XI-2 [Symbiodinium natans]